MIDIVDIPINAIIPAITDVLSEQGIPDIESANERTRKIVQRSISDYTDLSRPKGMIKEISSNDFKNVYRGEGHNEPETPLDLIYPESGRLALFAVTLGEDISRGITSYFDRDEFAAGSMLDSAASAGTEMAADYVESYYKKKIDENGKRDGSIKVMRFSPGYCGWHVSGQKKLFEYLRPEKIGIDLTDSCLMMPLKSISGVIAAGLKHIFEYDDSFAFCAECNDHSCIKRKKLLNENK